MKSCGPHSCRVVGAWVVKLQEWHPEGQAYAGLPTDLNDARERLAARMTLLAQVRPQPTAFSDAKPVHSSASLGLTGYCLDIRYRG